MNLSRIKFGELHLNNASLRYIAECVSSEWLSAGPFVERLEALWSKTFKTKHSIAVSSGTSAGTAACMALYAKGAIEHKSQVICPALSFIATANAIRMAGLIPHFVDVGWDLQIDVDQVVAAINKDTIAINAVNLMGVPCQLGKLREIADEYNLYLLVDNCEGYGLTFAGKSSLMYGHMETASCYVAHQVSGGTEGGMVATNDDEFNAMLRAIRSHGRTKGLYFDHEYFGGNFKQTDLHAAAILGSLEEYPETNAKRIRNLDYMLDRIMRPGILTNTRRVDAINAPHALNVVVEQGTLPQLKESFDKQNIEYKRTFGCMPTQHGAFSNHPQAQEKFPVAEYIGDNSVHVGCHQYLAESDLERIIIAFGNYEGSLGVDNAIYTSSRITE